MANRLIIFEGQQCVGKTTLCSMLKDKFGIDPYYSLFPAYDNDFAKKWDSPMDSLKEHMVIAGMHAYHGINLSLERGMASWCYYNLCGNGEIEKAKDVMKKWSDSLVSWDLCKIFLLETSDSNINKNFEIKKNTTGDDDPIRLDEGSMIRFYLSFVDQRLVERIFVKRYPLDEESMAKIEGFVQL